MNIWAKKHEGIEYYDIVGSPVSLREHAHLDMNHEYSWFTPVRPVSLLQVQLERGWACCDRYIILKNIG